MSTRRWIDGGRWIENPGLVIRPVARTRARSAMLEASVASCAPDWPTGHTVCLWKREGVPVLAAFHAEGVSTLKTARVARLWTRPPFPPPRQTRPPEPVHRIVQTARFNPFPAEICGYLHIFNLFKLGFEMEICMGEWISVFKVLL